MTTRYSDVKAKCPFFKSGGDRCVNCEGLFNKSTLSVTFDKREDLVKYRSLFCESYYEKCKIHRILEKKYE